MTTTAPTPTKSELLIRFNRNLDLINKFKRTLNSYRFEPNCYEDFKKTSILKEKLTELEEVQLRLLDRIYYQPESFEEYSDTIKDCILECSQLEVGIQEYLNCR